MTEYTAAALCLASFALGIAFAAWLGRGRPDCLTQPSLAYIDERRA